MRTQMLKKFLPFLGHGDSLLNIFGHPYFIARFSLRSHLKALISAPSYVSVLDIGCGSMPYRDLFKFSMQYHGLEIDQKRNHLNPNVRFFYDGLTIPIGDNSYDAAICSQVLEHSFTPEKLLSEACRVLKPGGSIFLTIPFFWPEHEQPFDSQRFTSYGIIDRLRKAGFESFEIRKSNIGLSTLLQLTIEWIEATARKALPPIPLVFVLFRCITIIPYTAINLCALSSRCLIDSNSANEMYLDLVVSANKPQK